MKSEISRDSYQGDKRYSGLYQQQGRMLTDADWNELVDILKRQLQEALQDVVGNGSPRHRNLINNDAAPLLEWGYLYVDGIQALVRPDDDAASSTEFEYLHQHDFPGPPALPVAPANYTLYADVWERTVTQLMDERLRDRALHGADTCTRKQVMAQVKWAPPGLDPSDSADNPARGDAAVTITLLQTSTEPDPCDPCAAQVDVESRVGNYLFRVEVHDVQGAVDNPDAITLKWSVENGAIQCDVADGSDAPDHFTAGDWAYEFFDEVSERHLGLHLVDNGWLPQRSSLSELYARPSDASGLPNDFVRRWDGFCTLTRSGSNWSVDSQYGNREGASFVTIDGSEFTIALSALEIVVELNDAIMAGDYWLAEVRESVHQPDDILIESAQPHGIEHHYLTIGTVLNGDLQIDPEADRKHAFPPLTEMTSLYLAGGDGQEVVPGDALPQPLRVGVANGEWPVKGAQVRFQSVADDGALSPLDVVDTDDDGIAEYSWTPDDALDAFLLVQATLVDPLDPAADLELPPLYFSANLVSADQVAYEPQCPPDSGADQVHHLLLGPDDSRLGTDGYYTVKEVLDALLCELGSQHIPYSVLGCGDAASPTVRSLLADLDFNGDGHHTVKDVLDTLLCRLTASHLPYDPSGKSDRWDDVNAEEGDTQPLTVQDAIDDLVDNLQSEDVKYSPMDCGVTATTLKDLLLPLVALEAGDGANQYRIKALWDALLCHLNAEMIPINKNDPALCADLGGDPDVTTVQDALRVLCGQRSGGGCCTIVISEGEDIAARLAGLSGSGVDAHISITHGNYILSEPVRLEGCGHITIQGCGDGSYIEAPHSESVFVFEKCQSVVVRELSLRSGKLGNKGAEDHLNGALTIRNCDKVIVEQMTLMCATGERKKGSCLTIAHDRQSPSVLVRDSYIKPGAQQVGILLVNVDRARVEGNEVKVRPRSKRKQGFISRLKHRGFRLTLRKQMMFDVEVLDSKVPPSDEGNVIEIPYGIRSSRRLRFRTQAELAGPWSQYFRDNPIPLGFDEKELINYAKNQADGILKEAGAGTVFEEWIDKIKQYLPAIAAQGIVCGGRVANDLAISENALVGVAQGVHVGLSHGVPNDGVPDIAGRVVVSANRVVNYQSAQVLEERHGIFVGNVDSLHVENNHLQLEMFPLKAPPFDHDIQPQGIRLFGHFGGMLQVRGNRLNGYQTGLFARAVNAATKEPELWQVENNLLAGGSSPPFLTPVTRFIASHNHY